jgi:sugar/nucleoside kinase (ribokinase family)
MSFPRHQTCQSTAEALRLAAPKLPAMSAVLGFDGFVDEIIAVVDKRHGPDRYDPVESIAAMARKILGASGESSNYELIVKQRKLGGNGPIMANALASLGLGVTYIGNLGYLQTLGDVNWETLLTRVGKAELSALMGGATLIGMLNWTMLPRVGEIWDKLLEEILPDGPKAGRTLFVDLADPEKRTREDLRGALHTVSRFQEQVDVILGLNLKEATQVADVLGLPDRPDREATIEQDAAEIRQALGLACVVIHPRKAAAAATETESARFPGPFVQLPKISTGAGDHFNAGFCLGRILGMGLEESLCAGVASSGYYVRTAQSPSALELAGFIEELPAPEG